jgi:hypothetical protein
MVFEHPGVAQPLSVPAQRLIKPVYVPLSRSSRQCERAMSDTGSRFTFRPLTEDEGSGLTEDEGSGYQVEFPDLPDCMRDGETAEGAIANGEDANSAGLRR